MNAPVGEVGVGALQQILISLGELEPAGSESDAMDRIAVLEAIKAGCAAAQAVETMRLEELRVEAESAAGVPKARQGRGLAAEVALARKASGSAGGRYFGFARALMREMPHTRAALASGALTEWRAMILVRETAHLTPRDRGEIDRRICADVSVVEGVGDRALDAEVKRLAYELDPQAVVDRHALAQSDRRVSTRPAPDGMVRLSALLPLVSGISVFASLKKHADATVGGDERTHAQVMADALVERVTGAATVDALPVAVNVVLPDEVLLGDSPAAAHVTGYGPIPADTARAMVSTALDADTASTLRRLYKAPASGALVAMDSTARLFPAGLKTFLDFRDQSCRIPYCDAPIAEYDHAEPHSRGGETSADNGSGMCVSHNRAKQNPGWQMTTDHDTGRHVATVTTPTGHSHVSRAPAPPGHHDHPVSPVERQLLALLDDAA
ncbi:HNH endonuclease [Williamsia sp. MIQD14]|uniref:HNH endonuclease n=1 Tax=Williamsia sp. MIQD14 TaxID=3425703 RepID=UPI003DA04BCC